MPTSSHLTIQYGQTSSAGVKPQNEDCYGIFIPDDDLLKTKGIAVAIADGVSASEGGKEASQIAVKQFLDDYFCTSEAWTVKHATTKILSALNSWLFNQGQRNYDGSNGLATTLSILVLKSQTAHIFHIGDSRIYRWRNQQLTCLTQDHRIKFSAKREYLARALGVQSRLAVDYQQFQLHCDDLYLLTTDGVHDVLSDEQLSEWLSTQDLETANSAILQQATDALVAKALAADSQDNITCQLVRIENIYAENHDEFQQRLNRLPFPPDLNEGMVLDGYQIIRELNATSRSQVYLAKDTLNTDKPLVVIKTPSMNYDDDPTYIDLFLHEEWVAKRLNSPHLISVYQHTNAYSRRSFLYSVVEYIQGQTLAQWMRDHPKPSLVQFRATMNQIARGLRAMHRMEMVHQDLKPDNILIDQQNTLKIIDFGSTRIAGLIEIKTILQHNQIVGTANYSAPEYFKGATGTNQADIYSLGVIAYEMLTGQLPYGKIEPQATARKRFHYRSVRHYCPEIPEWIDAAIEKATQPLPEKRYEALSEFITDITRPNAQLMGARKPKPLIERHPIKFWQGFALLEMIIICGLLIALFTE